MTEQIYRKKKDLANLIVKIFIKSLRDTFLNPQSINSQIPIPTLLFGLESF